ncbi:MAG TPA: cell division protein FtsZ [Thermoplasmata archaeon]
MLEKLIKEVLDREPDFEAHLAPKICVVGCGGGGSNSVHRLQRFELNGIETIAINTDKFHLSRTNSDKQILIGEHMCHGYGAGGDPLLGEKAALFDIEKIDALVRDYDIVFITAGMGGGTGTGTAPVVAEAAKKHGAIVVALVTLPFDIEKGRLRAALAGIAKLKERAHSTIILDNNRLLEIVPKLPVEQAFMVMDQLIAEVIKGITDTICQTSMINLDFADFRNVMLHGGASTVLYGESEDPEKVVLEALNNPLLDVDIEGASGALIHITGGPSLSLRKAYQVFNGVTSELGAQVNVKLGARIDEDFGGNIKLIGIITGLPSLDGRQSALGETGVSLESCLVDVIG